MRYLGAVMLLLLFPLPYAWAETWKIGPKGVGPIAIGMPIDQALPLIKQSQQFSVKEKSRMVEGSKQMVYEARDAKGLAFLLEPVDGMVWRSEIRSPALRTVKGAGVGTTYTELRNIYPDVEIYPAETGSCAVTQSGRLGYSFCFVTAKPSGKDTVTQVLVYEMGDV